MKVVNINSCVPQVSRQIVRKGDGVNAPRLGDTVKCSYSELAEYFVGDPSLPLNESFSFMVGANDVDEILSRLVTSMSLGERRVTPIIRKEVHSKQSTKMFIDLELVQIRRSTGEVFDFVEQVVSSSGAVVKNEEMDASNANEASSSGNEPSPEGKKLKLGPVITASTTSCHSTDLDDQESKKNQEGDSKAVSSAQVTDVLKTPALATPATSDGLSTASPSVLSQAIQELVLRSGSGAPDAIDFTEKRTSAQFKKALDTAAAIVKKAVSSALAATDRIQKKDTNVAEAGKPLPSSVFVWTEDLVTSLDKLLDMAFRAFCVPSKKSQEWGHQPVYTYMKMHIIPMFQGRVRIGHLFVEICRRNQKYALILNLPALKENIADEGIDLEKVMVVEPSSPSSSHHANGKDVDMDHQYENFTPKITRPRRGRPPGSKKRGGSAMKSGVQSEPPASVSKSQRKGKRPKSNQPTISPVKRTSFRRAKTLPETTEVGKKKKAKKGGCDSCGRGAPPTTSEMGVNTVQKTEVSCQTENGGDSDEPAAKKMRLDLSADDAANEAQVAEEEKLDEGFVDGETEAHLTLLLEDVADKNKLAEQTVETVLGEAVFTLSCSVEANKQDQEVLRVNVYCTTPPLTGQWSCSARLEFQLQSSNPEVSVDLEVVHDFSTDSALSSRKLILLSELLSVENGFLVGPEKKVQLDMKIGLLKVGSRVLEPYDFDCAGFEDGCQGCHVTFDDGQKYCINPEYIKLYSSVLEKLLPNNDRTQVSEVHLKDVNGSDFAQFLNAVYPHHYLVSAGNVETLTRMSHKYKVGFIHEQCESFLLDDPKSSVMPFLVQLDLACEYKMPRLQRKCLRSLKTARDIRELRSSEFFPRTSASTRGQILNRLMALEDWA